MATLQATTASNWPAVDPDSVDTIETIIADYAFIGNWENLTVAVEESRDGDPYLVVYGYAAFEATKPIYDDDGTVVDREYDCTEEFLERVAPHLEEQLVVQTVGFEKCRFPLLAGQWAVWPDGPVHYESFDHAPSKPDVTDEPER